MKKFMTDIKTLAALFIAGSAFTACSSDDNFEQPVPPTESQVYTLVIQASKGSETTTRALSLDGTTLNAYWSGTETIEVEQNGVKIGTATAAASADGTTTITATLTSAPSTSSDIKFYLCGGDIDYKGQVGLLTDDVNKKGISEKYDYNTALIQTGNFEVSGNTVNITNNTFVLNFENPEQAVVKFTLKDKGNSDAAINATKLNIHDSTNGLIQSIPIGSVPQDWTYGDVTISPATTNVIYAALAGVYQSNLTLTASDGDHVFSYSKSGVSFNRGDYYEITVKMNKILTNVAGTNPLDILTGGYTAISVEKAQALAKECWTVAGNTVYVVYNASANPYRVDYASYDGTTIGTGSATNATDLATLYGGGSNTAWFVEPHTMAATGHALSESVVGDVVGTDGKAYAVADKDNLPTGVTAVAMVAYKNGTSGLAISLTDVYETNVDFNQATGEYVIPTWAAAHPITGGEWRLPTEEYWQYMMWGSYNQNRGTESISTFQTNLGAVGEALVNDAYYWTSTVVNDANAKAVYYKDGLAHIYDVSKANYWHIRTCLAF